MRGGSKCNESSLTLTSSITKGAKSLGVKPVWTDKAKISFVATVNHVNSDVYLSGAIPLIINLTSLDVVDTGGHWTLVDKVISLDHSMKRSEF